MEENKNNKTDKNGEINIDDIDILKHLQNQSVDVKAKEDESKKGKWKKTAVGGGLLAAALKFKTILLLLLGKLKFIFIFLKLGKIFGTCGSMILMIWAEAMRYGWLFGIGFVMLIFAHEMGHYLMAKKEGLDVGTPIFIPFVGAFISMKEVPESVKVESKVALAGPIVGSIAALMLIPVYEVTGAPVFRSLAYSGIMLNIFNLIPISPLDGGRAVAALSTKLWGAGLVLVVGCFFFIHSPMLLIIAILGLVQIYNIHKKGKDLYYELSMSKRVEIGIIYFGLVAFLGITAYLIYNVI